MYFSPTNQLKKIGGWALFSDVCFTALQIRIS